jgi:hypothetical protein
MRKRGKDLSIATLRNQTMPDSHNVINCLLTIDYEVVKGYTEEEFIRYLHAEFIQITADIKLEMDRIKDNEKNKTKL